MRLLLGNLRREWMAPMRTRTSADGRRFGDSPGRQRSSSAEMSGQEAEGSLLVTHGATTYKTTAFSSSVFIVGSISVYLGLFTVSGNDCVPVSLHPVGSPQAATLRKRSAFLPAYYDEFLWDVIPGFLTKTMVKIAIVGATGSMLLPLRSCPIASLTPPPLLRRRTRRD